MTLLLAIMLQQGLDLSAWWYAVIVPVWTSGDELVAVSSVNGAGGRDAPQRD